MDPGCSAISPPRSAQPACRHPSATPDTSCLHLIGVELPGDDVVEEEQRLGPHADEVVDAHGDEVDADGVEAAGVAAATVAFVPTPSVDATSTGCE